MISNILKSDVHVSQHGSFAHSLIMFFEGTNIYETKIYMKWKIYVILRCLFFHDQQRSW